VRMIEEVCRATGAEAIRVEGCDSCSDARVIRDSTTILAELKRSVEGRGNGCLAQDVRGQES
ncbi:MAG: hypothetical protein NEA02_14360, partial [Thermoanaerobaculia bacterium]|nr:hypothetical protein [Thermoanaerobaculia bacterium]